MLKIGLHPLLMYSVWAWTYKRRLLPLVKSFSTHKSSRIGASRSPTHVWFQGRHRASSCRHDGSLLFDIHIYIRTELKQSNSFYVPGMNVQKTSHTPWFKILSQLASSRSNRSIKVTHTLYAHENAKLDYYCMFRFAFYTVWMNDSLPSTGDDAWLLFFIPRRLWISLLLLLRPCCLLVGMFILASISA